MTLTTVLADINTVSAAFNDNVIIKEAKASILENLQNTEMSTEERDTLYSMYMQQLSAGILAQAVALAKEMPILSEQELKLTQENAILTIEKDALPAVKAKELEILTEQELRLTQENAILTIEKDALPAVKAKELRILAEQELKLIEEVIKIRYDKLQSLASLKKQFGYSNATELALGDSTDDGLIDKQIIGFDKDMFYKIGTMVSNENQMLAQNDLAVQPWQVDVLKLAYEAMSDGKINIRVADGWTAANWDGTATAPNGLEF